MRILSKILIILLLTGTAYATPDVDPITGTLTHGESKVITGTGFGTKSPAAPVLWDDGEGTHTLADRYTGYEPTGFDATMDIQYHSGTFRGMTNPHSHGTRYISGGHYDGRPSQEYTGGTGANVGVTKSFGTEKEVLFITWYQAYDPLWPTDSPFLAGIFTSNNKIRNWERAPSTALYGGVPLAYNIFAQSGANGCSIERNCTNLRVVDNNVDSSDQTDCMDNTAYCVPKSVLLGAWGKFEEVRDFNGPSWIRVFDQSSRTYANSIVSYVVAEDGDSRYGASIGGYFCYQDSYTTITSGWSGPDGNGEWTVDFLGEEPLILFDHTAVLKRTKGTVGSLASTEWGYSDSKVYLGYDPSGRTFSVSRSCCTAVSCGSQEHGGDANAFRFFDDVYIDTTFSRIMLCNNVSLANATVCEPQIPTAWSDTGATFTVNLGKLTGDLAWVYVFDSTNTANTVGEAVSLVEGEDTTPPITALLSYPTNPTISTSATFTFTDNEVGSTYQCNLDSAGYATCTTPKAYTSLALGSHNFLVRAIDSSSNVDASPESYDWTINVTPQTSPFPGLEFP